MPGLLRPMSNAYRLYLGYQFAMAAGLGLAQATIIVYWVTVARLDPLQLVLLGTVLEVAYVLLQLPTGMLADLVSRRLCVVAGVFAVALGYLLQGASRAFAALLAAQVFVALGAALMYGAQESWIADELAQETTTHVYVRAEQLGLAGTVVGSLGSGFLALAGLRLPLLAGGVLMVLRGASATLRGQLHAAGRSVRAVPGLVLVFGMTFFFGMWSESFDRLWGDVLVVLLGTARTFAVAIVGYLVVSALRPAYEPLVTGWMVVRVDARVRATALSARDMCDASGQIAGGPAIGAVGNLVSVRAALLAGAAALGPAMILLIAATRRIRAEFTTVAAADPVPVPVPVTGTDQA